MRDIIKKILKEETSKDNKIDFYMQYYENLTPSNLKVSKEDGKIIIEGFEEEVKNINIFKFLKSQLKENKITRLLVQLVLPQTKDPMD